MTSPTRRLWGAIGALAIRSKRRAEVAAFTARRLAAIEDRLAALDDGDDAAAARKRALAAMVSDAVDRGESAPSMRLREDGTVHFTGDLSDEAIAEKMTRARGGEK